MRYLWQRFYRFLIALLSLVVGVVLTVFAYSNTARVSLDLWQFHYENVPVGMLAIIPLIVGIVLGYLYHVPAGVHDFMHNMQLTRQIHHLEKENKDLKHHLDQLLAMPEGVMPPALPAHQPAPPAHPEPLEAEPVMVHAVRDSHSEQAGNKPSVHHPARPAKAAEPEKTEAPVSGNGRAKPKSSVVAEHPPAPRRGGAAAPGATAANGGKSRAEAALPTQ
ncbi:MAG TPA: lipopolysaccharide assembly protein LapA domain-containing protein [Candidatus Dormibacteraeota bacterium]